MQCLLRRARIPVAAPLMPYSTLPLCTSSTTAVLIARPFSSLPSLFQKSMPSRPKPPPDSELEESYLKGSGPGGQKINKTNSAVQIKHIPTGIVVKSQATRSRAQNRKHAREILAQRLDDLYNGEQSRASIVGAVRKKRSDSAAKKSRRKYKKLEEEKAAAAAEQTEQGEQGEQSLDAKQQEQTDDVLPDSTEAAQQTDQTLAEHRSALEDRAHVSHDKPSTAASQPIDGTTRQ
ncbi:hypothetical protein PWT90_08440 [Aphanocladium album]|nr:hypothetical protein PWT90_08440 [Aphanocladium album]